MKKILLICLIVHELKAGAQQGVAITSDGSSPHNSAALDIKSTSKGLLIPRMTSTQRNAIANPATGLLIWQTDGTAGFYYYNGSAWTSFSAGAPAPSTSWSTTGNAGTDFATNFIGTTDNQPLIGRVNSRPVFYFASTNPSTFIGYEAGRNSIGLANHFSGYKAGYTNTTGYYNHFSGTKAGYSNDSGYSNHFEGHSAGYFNTSGFGNLFIGGTAGYHNTTGSQNFFIGNSSGHYNTTGFNNHFVGFGAGTENTTGTYNHFEGNQAGLHNTTGNGNFFQGYNTGRNNLTGSQNHFSGQQAGYSNTASQNHFVGYQAGFNNTTGNYNHFDGFGAGSYNSTGAVNMFVGYQSGFNNTIGGENQFNGYRSGFSNTTGSKNHFNGHEAGYSNTTGSENYFSGNGAGYKNSVGLNNTYIGYEAGHENIGGVSNVMIGHQAGYYELGSDKLYISNSFTANPLIYGEFGNQLLRINGQAEIKPSAAEALTIRRNGFMSIEFKNPAYAMPVQVSIGANYDGTFAGSKIVFHAAGTNMLTLFGTGNAVLAGTLTQLSDSRLKTNISTLTGMLSRLMRLRAVSYNWIYKQKDSTTQIGFIAQELEKEFPQLVRSDEKGIKSIAYANMTPILLEAIKEQQQLIEDLKRDNNELKTEILAIKKLLSKSLNQKQ